MGDNQSFENDQDFDDNQDSQKGKYADQDMMSTGDSSISERKGCDYFGQPKVCQNEIESVSVDDLFQSQLQELGLPKEQLMNQFCNHDENSNRQQKSCQDARQYKTRKNYQYLKVFQLTDFNRFMVKNVNMPKFLIRIFIRNLKKYRSMYKSEQSFLRAIRKSEKMDEFAKEDKKNYLSLKHLQQLFLRDKDDSIDCQENRRVMHSMIRNEIGRQIFKNPQVKHKLSYAVATKTYALRCFNSILALRVQSK